MEKQTTPFAGHYRLFAPEGAEVEASDARLEVSNEALVVSPEKRPQLRLDFADFDRLDFGDYLLSAALAGGETAELSMLGSRFDEFSDQLAESLRVFQARNLMLEEPVGGDTFSCDLELDGEESPAQIRVYATSVAVIPARRTPFGIPLGEVKQFSFDEDRWALDFELLDGRRISLLRLGQRTDPCRSLVEKRLASLRSRHQEALTKLLPSIRSLAVRRVAETMPDGVPASRRQLDAIDPAIWSDLVAACATPELKACFELLAAQAMPEEIAAGMKETNFRQDGQAAPDDPESPDGNVTSVASTALEGRVLWFLFPIVAADRRAPGNAIALEAISGEGRATYLFRIASPEAYRAMDDEALVRAVRERMASLSRALVALSFKREPIYLPDAQINSPKYARYRLALRLLEPLKQAREAFVGRAIHGAGWKKQLESALEKAVS